MTNVLSGKHKRVRRMRADQSDPSRSKAAREQAKTRRAERDAKKDRRA